MGWHPRGVPRRLGLGGRSGVQTFLITLAIVSLVVMAAFFPQPKKGLKPKKTRKPIPRRGPIRVRDNPLKANCRKPLKKTQAQCIAEYRAEQLANTSPAVEALESALRGLGIRFRREEVVLVDYRRFFLVDVYCPDLRICFEADGQQHKEQRVYDNDRDAIIERLMVCKVIRRWNGWFLSGDLKHKILCALNDTKARRHEFERV